ncbi:hypothetical protein EGW08_022731 [Elysia chlorotica]|uniref:Uncharacterized protein n=1 Tax=Elysia chlorotica TaxID=188477 RepID=A0A433SK70_ELYCH|nr:hypothetical protein EGW08_022731 [Elysia chlorotica]
MRPYFVYYWSVLEYCHLLRHESWYRCLASVSTTKINKLVNIFNVFVPLLQFIGLFVVDSHGFSLPGVYLESSFPGFFCHTIELLLYVLLLLGEKADVVCKVKILQLLHEGPLDTFPSTCCILSHNRVNHHKEDRWGEQATLAHLMALVISALLGGLMLMSRSSVGDGISDTVLVCWSFCPVLGQVLQEPGGDLMMRPSRVSPKRHASFVSTFCRL